MHPLPPSLSTVTMLWKGRHIVDVVVVVLSMLTWEREGEREKERVIRCHRCCSPIIDVDVGDGWGEGEGDALSSYCC